MAAHLAEDERSDAATAIIGMSADPAEGAAQTAALADLRKRTRVADDQTVRFFVNGDHDRLVKVGENRLFPSGIVDRVEKLGKPVMLGGVVVRDLNSAFRERG